MKEIVQSNYINIEKQILESMIHKKAIMLNTQSKKSYKKHSFFFLLRTLCNPKN